MTIRRSTTATSALLILSFAQASFVCETSVISKWSLLTPEPYFSLLVSPRSVTSSSSDTDMPDLERQKSSENPHRKPSFPIETPKIVASATEKMDNQLRMIPSNEKKGWTKAKRLCPELTDITHRLTFLRAEDFDARAAARKLVTYWDKRIEIFGPEKAFQPLTLNKALKDDGIALSYGVWRLVGTRDDSGRSIIFADPSRHDNSKYDLRSMTRANWYIMHAALEDEQTQKRGCIFITFLKNIRLTQLDPSMANASLGSECLPIRIAGFHICHPPKVFGVIFRLIQPLVGSKYRDLIKIHTGSSEQVLQELEKCGIPRGSIPLELGGDVDIDHQSWLKARTSAGL